jgi:phage gp36-like protein
MSTKTVHIFLASSAGQIGLKIRLFPLTSGTEANTPGGDILTEDSNGHFTAQIDDSLDGVFDVDVVSSAAVVIWEGGHVDMDSAVPIVDAVSYAGAVGLYTGTPVITVEALNIVFGADNTRQWADADNDNDPVKIAARISWASNEARMYIEGRLSSRYKVPFEIIPTAVINLIIMQTGIELYRAPRGLVDGDQATAQINSIALRVEDRLDKMLAGQLALLKTPSPRSYPGVTNEIGVPTCPPSLNINGDYPPYGLGSFYSLP